MRTELDVNDVVTGLLAVVVGGLFCFFGYLAMRMLIPLWGAFAGFVLGAGLVAGIANEGFLSSLLAWVVGLAVALIFGLVAYLYYEVSIVIAMGGIGFALGTSVMVSLGVTWSWVIVVVGVLAAVLLAVIAIAGDLPTVLLIVLTALGGASVAVFGILLLVGKLNTGDLDAATTTEQLDDPWWVYALYGVLAVAGIIVQTTRVSTLRSTVRAQWAESGGRQMRAG